MISERRAVNCRECEPIRTMSKAASLLAILTCFLATGCSQSNDAIISGMVNIDGKPAQSGTIAFFPVDEKSRTTGGPIKEGKYSVHVPVGMQKVEIRVPKVVGQGMGETLPAEYNNQSKLTLDVKPGDNTKDFDLKTK